MGQICSNPTSFLRKGESFFAKTKTFVSEKKVKKENFKRTILHILGEKN